MVVTRQGRGALLPYTAHNTRHELLGVVSRGKCGIETGTAKGVAHKSHARGESCCRPRNYNR